MTDCAMGARAESLGAPEWHRRCLGRRMSISDARNVAPADASRQSAQPWRGQNGASHLRKLLLEDVVPAHRLLRRPAPVGHLPRRLRRRSPLAVVAPLQSATPPPAPPHFGADRGRVVGPEERGAGAVHWARCTALACQLPCCPPQSFSIPSERRAQEYQQAPSQPPRRARPSARPCARDDHLGKPPHAFLAGN